MLKFLSHTDNYVVGDQVAFTQSERWPRPAVSLCFHSPLCCLPISFPSQLGHKNISFSTREPKKSQKPETRKYFFSFENFVPFLSFPTRSVLQKNRVRFFHLTGDVIFKYLCPFFKHCWPKFPKLMSTFLNNNWSLAVIWGAHLKGCGRWFCSK